MTALERALAERMHILGQDNFRALSECFRHEVDGYDETLRAVAAIVNPRTARRVAAVT